MTILLAGDGFVTAKVLRRAIEERSGAASKEEGPGEASKPVVAKEPAHREILAGIELNAIQSNWPNEPFHDYAGVREAFGDEDELIAALPGARVCFSHTYPFSEKVLAASPDLELITICRGGPVNVDLAAATRHGVIVSYTPGRNAVATAEHSVAMIMAAARQIAQRDAEIKAGQWRSDYYNYDAVGPEIAGKTAGVCGYGAVGSRVARILQAMDAHVVVYDPWIDAAKLEAGMELVPELDRLLERADILTLHSRLTPENRGMIGGVQIAQMPQGAILVNCARGGLLDYDAVADALDSGHLYAAAFDCLPEEPLPPGHRLFSTPRVTMTPHLAGASKQAAELAATIGARDIAAFLAGERPQFCANPEVFESEALRAHIPTN